MEDVSGPVLRVVLEGRRRPGLRAAGWGAALATALGGFWASAYPLPPTSAAALVALHALAGAGLGALAGACLGAHRGGFVGALLVLGALGPMPALLAPPTGTPGVLAPRPLVAVQVHDAMARRVAVIGLDGADWRVIDPLLAAGELPELAALLARGRGWVLRSLEPSHSPVVWSSIFSGKRPEAHGIESWQSARADNRRAAMLWELVGAAGLPALAVNVPGSWPPTAIEGALISGFPMPSPLLPATQATGFQNLGTLVDPEGRDARLPVVLAAAGEDEARVVLGRAAARSRLGLRHPGIEAAAARRGLPTRPIRVRIAAEELAPGAWSGWRRDAGAGAALVYRVHRLADRRLWFTPAFQDPRLPSLPFTSAPEVQQLLAAQEPALGPYVVEGAGWRLAREPALRPVLIEHLEAVEARRLHAAQALLEAVPDWRLLAHVITLPDRVSHAFWHLHEPAGGAASSPGEAAHRERVRDAYRAADRHLGALRAQVDDGRTLILVASDHGFRAGPAGRHGAPGWGTHRDAGILVAAGPGVAPSRRREERTIFDLTPLVLAALGMPVADDMLGSAPPELVAEPRRIASYERAGAASATRQRIDETTNEQLRSLGYVE